MEKYRDIEKSIIKKYRKEIWTKFVKAVKDYELIAPNDKIAVCLSGGKDSFLLAKCLQELKRHGQYEFSLAYLLMDPGYTKSNLAKIQKTAKQLNISLTIFKTDVFAVAQKLNPQAPCYLCARMRRGHLYDQAQKLGCNKIALGHHFDDVIETILLSEFYGGEFKTMLPKLHSDNFKGMELIRPLYLIKEEAILSWQNYNELTFVNCACSFVKNNNSSKREEIKSLIKELKKTNPYLEANIFKSTHNVNLNTLMGYHNNVVTKTFLDEYDQK